MADIDFHLDLAQKIARNELSLMEGIERVKSLPVKMVIHESVVPKLDEILQLLFEQSPNEIYYLAMLLYESAKTT
ncbi:MAG: hypothetical protein GWN01_01685, partial [Nitrosopumilaceae archaeon]|nr:hypothetical protein [Nitrosopumilaceae archaeon]NIV64823.1 hypothetical protein [Nitrosopumilaceae archaeon]NIX60289.1 hypothetical protein [Nitrosopumilaceae archaeon]